MTLAPGANAPLTGTTIILKADVPTSPEIDITLLQTYDTGKIRGDDMCFYGQPSISGGAVKIDTTSQSMTIALEKIHPDIQKAHDYGTVDISNYKTFSADVTRQYRLEGGTRYGLSMERIRGFYKENNPENLPVFVMFVTDGGTDDKPKTKKCSLRVQKSSSSGK